MKSIAVIVTLLVLALAGCSGGDGDDDGNDGVGIGHGAGRGLLFNDVLVGPGGDAETSISVGPDGTILACSHGGFGQPSPSWVSEDNGTTWRRLDPQPNPIPSGDCDVAMLDDGTWAIVYDTIASATVASSRDRGQTWFVNFVAAIPFGGVDRPWLVAHHDTLVLAYANVMATEPAVNTVAISTDGGRTWLDQSIAHVFDSLDRLNAVIGKPLVDDDAIRLPIASTDLMTGENNPTWFDFAVSRDGGTTWRLEPVAGPYDSYFQLPAATRAGDGTLYATYSQRNDTGMDVWAAASHDEGKTWRSFLVAAGVNYPSVSGAWIDGRPDGTAGLAWVSDEDDGRTVFVARVDADGVVVAPTKVGQSAADDSVFEFVMLDHDAAGRVHLVYPLNTGANCHDNPMAGRGAQCIYAVNELP